MRLRALGGLAGGACGLLLGGAAASGAAGILAGFAWIFVFGDDPWPAYAEPAIAIGALVVGASVLAGCAFAGYLVARGREGRPGEARLRRAAWGLIGLAGAVAATLILGAFLAPAPAPQAERPAGGPVRSEALARLDADRHRIRLVQIAAGLEPPATVIVRSEGERRGAYRLNWRVRERVYGKVLLEGQRAIEIDASAHEEQFALDTGLLPARYNERVLNDRPGDVLVDEAFRFEAELIPILTPEETATLAAAERERLAAGILELAERAAADFPVRFTLRRPPAAPGIRG